MRAFPGEVIPRAKVLIHVAGDAGSRWTSHQVLGLDAKSMTHLDCSLTSMLCSIIFTGGGSVCLTRLQETGGLWLCAAWRPYCPDCCHFLIRVSRLSHLY